MRWAMPAVLLLLLLLVPLFLWQRRRRKRHGATLPISSHRLLAQQKQTLWSLLARQLDLLYLVVLALVILALARPQQRLAAWPIWGKGIDIMLVLDTSSSMLHEDLRPNRLEAAKALLNEFIGVRRQKNDRMGLVLFAREAYTLCTLTTDHRLLKEMLSNVQTGAIADDTALGDAIATALARLRHNKGKRRQAVILVTDGENNAGQVHPLVVSKLAKHMKVMLFPLLVGMPRPSATQKNAATQALTPWKVLQHVAKFSQGQAYRVKTQKTFQRSLQQILDRITPTRRKKPRYFNLYEEKFTWFLIPALALLGFLLLLELTRLRSFS